MKVFLSDIAKTGGASFHVEFKEFIKGMENEVNGYNFANSICFIGSLKNTDGVITLMGSLSVDYSVKCYSCLKVVTGRLNVNIEESFMKSGALEDVSSEVYTYDGEYVEIDRALRDNIILNLPMRQLCMRQCKGLCTVCGTDLNISECQCRTEENEINPKMQVLQSFFR